MQDNRDDTDLLQNSAAGAYDESKVKTLIPWNISGCAPACMSGAWETVPTPTTAFMYF